MPKAISPPLAGLGVTIGLFLIFKLIGVSGLGPLAICLGLGLMAFGVLQSMAASAALPRAPEHDRDAALATPPPSGMARVIVYRSVLFAPETSVGKSIAVQLTLDGKKIAALPTSTFTSLFVSPGEHTFTVGVGIKAGVTTFRASADESLFFHLIMPGRSLSGKFAVTQNTNPAAVLASLKTLAMMSDPNQTSAIPPPQR